MIFLQAIAAVDDYQESPIIGQKQRPLRLQYEEIGAALLECEAASFRVGIPCLPPTDRVRNIRKSFDCNIEEHLRLNLVSVSTTALESYSDDLINESNEKNDELNLCIALESFVERQGPAIAAFLCGVACFLLIVKFLPLPEVFSYLIALIVGFGSGVSASTACSEQYRRYSFHKLLRREISRRHGTDKPGTTRLTLASVDPINQ